MADIFEEEEVPMTVAEYEEQLEEALAVLGADDPDKCTYDQGYRKRQALYSCLTCVPPPKIPAPPKKREGSEGGNDHSDLNLRDILSDDWNPAGICTACSLKCHDGHELVELYTRRQFRCDCGTSKFQGSATPRCQLQPEKEPVNDRNEYNQNYAGVYCTCRRPYPDPEAEARQEGEEMTQCVVCEDWFHDHHLGLEPGYEVPADFSELICSHCASTKCQFLKLYPYLLVAPERVDDAGDGDGLENEGTGAHGEESSGTQVSVDDSQQAEGSGREHQAEGAEAAKAKLPGEFTGSSPDERADSTSKAADNEADCKLAGVLGGKTLDAYLKWMACCEPTSGPKEDQGSVSAQEQGATGGSTSRARSAGADAQTIADLSTTKIKPLFLAEKWRASICNCQPCTRFYKEQGVEFLADLEDTLAFYEDEAKKIQQQREEEDSARLEAQFQSMDHVARVEVIRGMSNFKTDLQEFLTRFQGTDHVLTVQDVQQFVEENKAKRPRRV